MIGVIIRAFNCVMEIVGLALTIIAWGYAIDYSIFKDHKIFYVKEVISWEEWKGEK